MLKQSNNKSTHYVLQLKIKSLSTQFKLNSIATNSIQFSQYNSKSNHYQLNSNSTQSQQALFNSINYTCVVMSHLNHVKSKSA